MEQLPLFIPDGPHLVYSQLPGARRGQVHMSVTVYDEEAFAIAVAEYYGRYHKNIRSFLFTQARIALMNYRDRPFGDEYVAGIAHVSYLTER